MDSLVKTSRRPVDYIKTSDCQFCDGDWATAMEDDVPAEEALVVNTDQFRKHLGYHLQQTAMFSLPRLNQDDEVQSNAADAREDDLNGKEVPKMHRTWVNNNHGRGWRIISNRRAVFIAFAFFLTEYDGLQYKISDKMLNRDINFTPARFRKIEHDYYLVYHPAIRRQPKIEPVHDLRADDLIHDIQFSPDGKTLAAGLDEAVHIFSVETCGMICELMARSSPSTYLGMNSLCFSPDGRYLAAMGIGTATVRPRIIL